MDQFVENEHSSDEPITMPTLDLNFTDGSEETDNDNNDEDESSYEEGQIDSDDDETQELPSSLSTLLSIKNLQQNVIPESLIKIPLSPVSKSDSTVPGSSLPALPGSSLLQMPVSTVPSLPGSTLPQMLESTLTGSSLRSSTVSEQRVGRGSHGFSRGKISSEEILLMLPGLSITDPTENTNATIEDIMEREVDETIEEYMDRIILTRKLAIIPDYRLNAVTAVTVGSMIMKKAKLGIRYDNDMEGAISYLIALLGR